MLVTPALRGVGGTLATQIDEIPDPEDEQSYDVKPWIIVPICREFYDSFVRHLTDLRLRDIVIVICLALLVCGLLVWWLWPSEVEATRDDVPNAKRQTNSKSVDSCFTGCCEKSRQCFTWILSQCSAEKATAVDEAVMIQFGPRVLDDGTPHPNADCPLEMAAADEAVMIDVTPREYEIFSRLSKLYRFDGKTWEEKGLGEARLLRDTTGKVRFMMRQEKTNKVVCNHLVVRVPPYCDLLPSANGDPCWVWTAQDFAGDEMKVERFALKLNTPENAKAFKDAFDQAKQATSAQYTEKDSRKDCFSCSQLFDGQLCNWLCGNDEASATEKLEPWAKIGNSPGASFSSGELALATRSVTQEQSSSSVEEAHPKAEEEEIFSEFSKLYRFDGETWQEKCFGEAKLLKNTKIGKVRFIMRQEKTMKVVCNHLVVSAPPYCELFPSANGDPCWVWTAQDFADDEMKVERLALKLNTAENAKAFKDKFEQAKQV